MNKIFDVVVRRAVFHNTRLLYCGHYQVKFYHHINHNAPILTNTCVQGDSNLFLIKRFKHKKKSSVKNMQEVDESDEENEEEFESDESKSKSIIITTKLHSLRIDAVAKAGLGISRKKIEDAFLESKIRINGKKIFKLSAEVKTDDEIDLIRSRSDDNLNFLIVSRTTVLSIEPVSDGIRVKLSKDKSLLIEEYPEPWRN